VEDIFLLALVNVYGLGSSRIKLLREYFGDAKSVWTATESELAKVGMPKNVLENFLKTRKKIDPEKYIQELEKKEISWITIDSVGYPARLKQISDPPVVLFIKRHSGAPRAGGESGIGKDGFWTNQNDDLSTEKIIGVVGTRKMTSYGREVTEGLTTGLVNSGFTIVSGMALGVDGVAHQTTIDLGGKTIAVLGAGVDVVYPPEHGQLYEDIIKSGGAVVSEVAPEKLVGKGIFPARNRIISGLSQALLVTEGSLDSGSLITARLAIDQGREVFAVPGPINSPMAQGTNFLLKQGARLVTGVEDILEALGYSSNLSNLTNLTNLAKGETEEEQKVIDLLKIESLEFDDLVREPGITASKLGAVLGGMEVKGLIKNNGTGFAI
jgi:DNA processing protein